MMSNKDIFMDQQKLTLDFIQKNYEEVMLRCNVDKVKTGLPCIVTVQKKIKKLIDNSLKEKQREKEKIRKKFEETIGKSSLQESNKENLNSNIKAWSDSEKKIIMTDGPNNYDLIELESLQDSTSPTKTPRQESIEGMSGVTLHSHRSTSSNWSTTDVSLKKDILNDEKEQTEVKYDTHVECEENSTQNYLDTLKKTNKTTKIEDSVQIKQKENNLKDKFDQSIYERLTRSPVINGDEELSCRMSRFPSAQEVQKEEILLLQKGIESNVKNFESEEFNHIAKMIAEFVVTQEFQNDSYSGKMSFGVNGADGKNEMMKARSETSKIPQRNRTLNLSNNNNFDKIQNSQDDFKNKLEGNIVDDKN